MKFVVFDCYIIYPYYGTLPGNRGERDDPGS